MVVNKTAFILTKIAKIFMWQPDFANIGPYFTKQTIVSPLLYLKPISPGLWNDVVTWGGGQKALDLFTAL